MPADFDTVTKFEQEVAQFYGAPFAVATDSCTHAIELCLRLEKPKFVNIPHRTYVSIPMTAKKLGIHYYWNFTPWFDYYHLTRKIIDAAVYWKKDGYIPGTMMCLSFQFQKHLSTIRGGMILTDVRDKAEILTRMSYDGRTRGLAWRNQNIKMMGYHYYMTPETAELGLDNLGDAKRLKPRRWSSDDYPDLTTMKVFQ